MLERFDSVLKIICLGLAVFMLSQFWRVAARKHPLERLNIPALLVSSAGSNTLSGAKATNLPPLQEIARNTTNVPPTNKAPECSQPGHDCRPAPGDGKDGSGPPPAIQARVERITQSEILGAVIRPLPMALLGIAGHDAVLRSPSGQTGLLKEGEELGGGQAARIGTNRVLIEHEGQRKELTVFFRFRQRKRFCPKKRRIPSETTAKSHCEVRSYRSLPLSGDRCCSAVSELTRSRHSARRSENQGKEGADRKTHRPAAIGQHQCFPAALTNALHQE